MVETLTPETLVPLRYENNTVLILDQSLLPHTIAWVPIETYTEMIEAIATMKIRGAPAIGVAGAFGVALGVKAIADRPDFKLSLSKIVTECVAARPTAVNLAWACKLVQKEVEHTESPTDRIKKALELATWVKEDDLLRCQTIGKVGAELIQDGDDILTICNAGALATAGHGTALGVIRSAAQDGKQVHVWVSETRPRLQGAKLTALELKTLDIPYTLITDNMAGFLMAQDKVSIVLAGADRIAANGDSANKIGTYSLAVLAQAHSIPFYVAAPWSTIDLDCATGADIPLEYRHEKEVTHINDTPISVSEARAHTVAFDITPKDFITGFITEKGLVAPPFSR